MPNAGHIQEPHLPAFAGWKVGLFLLFRQALHRISCDFPADLIELRRRYDQADAKVNKHLDEGGEPLREARAERLDIVSQLYAHPWFGTVDQFKAREALKVAAREAQAPAE